MSLVDAETGELVELLNESSARRLIARINGTAAELIDLTLELWSGRAWLALGYGTWDELCDAEITLPRLEPPQQAELRGALRSAGMSTRAIASVTGASQSTVSRSLRGESNDSPARDVEQRFKTKHAPAKVTGTDGKKYTTRKPTPTRADAIARYPWLDVPAPIAQIVATADALDAYTGNEKVRRIEAGKKWAAMVLRRAECGANGAAEDAAQRSIDQALDLLVKFNVAAAKCLDAFADFPHLVDDEFDQWSGSIESATDVLGRMSAAVKPALRRVK